MTQSLVHKNRRLAVPVRPVPRAPATILHLGAYVLRCHVVIIAQDFGVLVR